MARQPTGRGRGRPKGSGELGEQMRLTVRIPLTLYERLQVFAEGRVYTRSAPQLAVCVREALEEYLACRQTGLANKGQTMNTPLPQEENNRQTKNIPTMSDDIKRQTRKVPGGTQDNYGQTENDIKPQAANLRQTENGTPAYDTGKYSLGKLCPRGHEHGSTGQSLLRISNRHCIACDREKFHERKAGKGAGGVGA